MRLKFLFKIFGGVNGEIGGKYIGLDGKSCAIIKINEEWGLRTSPCLMKQCWKNFHGGCSMMTIPCSLECSRRGFFQMVLFWMPKNQPLPHMHGEAFLLGGM